MKLIRFEHIDYLSQYDYLYKRVATKKTVTWYQLVKGYYVTIPNIIMIADLETRYQDMLKVKI